MRLKIVTSVTIEQNDELDNITIVTNVTIEQNYQFKRCNNCNINSN